MVCSTSFAAGERKHIPMDSFPPSIHNSSYPAEGLDPESPSFPIVTLPDESILNLDEPPVSAVIVSAPENLIAVSVSHE